MMFEGLEQFVAAHRACGELVADLGEMTETGVQRAACVFMWRRVRAMGHARGGRS
jgi:hypothetical protein